MNTIYTVGYQSYRYKALIEAVARLNALLVDIRFVPASSDARFTLKALRHNLGDRYTHLKLLGNTQYKSGGMQILNYDAGKAFISVYAERSPLILMCACYDFGACHRKVVGDMLTRDGFTVQELPPPPQDEPVQHALPFFDA